MSSFVWKNVFVLSIRTLSRWRIIKENYMEVCGINLELLFPFSVSRMDNCVFWHLWWMGDVSSVCIHRTVRSYILYIYVDKVQRIHYIANTTAGLHNMIQRTRSGDKICDAVIYRFGTQRARSHVRVAKSKYLWINRDIIIIRIYIYTYIEHKSLVDTLYK